MATSYNISMAGVPKKDAASLGLPVRRKLADGEMYVLDVWREEDVDRLYAMFEAVVANGQSYPQSSTSEDEFRTYFLSNYAFVVRKEGGGGDVAGSFYIKPNFPGRSSHLANYGLLVSADFRGRGVGDFMVTECIRLARLVGFRALYTNLVYANNVASIKLCTKHGFTQVGRVPNAGDLKGLGLVDALQFYKDVTLDDQISR